MSTITEKTKNGKVVAFKFPAHVGRDEKCKRHFCTTTWKPPAGMSYAKARKMAEAEAYKWEQELLRGEDDLNSFYHLFHKENAVFVGDFLSFYYIYY